MVQLLPTVLTEAVGWSVDAVKNTFIHVGPARGEVDLHPHPGAGDGKKVSTWSAEPSTEATQDIALSQAASETLQQSSLEPSSKASPAEAEHVKPAGAQHLAGVADAVQQPSLDIQPGKWESKLQAITELEKREEAGESLDQSEIELLVSKPEVQLEVQREENQACARAQLHDPSKCADGSRGCANQVWRERQVCDSGYLAITDANPASQCHSSYGACATTSYVGSAVGAGQGRKSRRAKAKASQLAKSARGCDDYKWFDPQMEMLYQQLNAGGAERRSALDAIRGKVLHLSTESTDSSWVVQRAFDNEVASLYERGCFAQELHGSVLRLISCPHGNYIVQRILEVLPTALIAFVAMEISGHASEVACDRHGCRVLPRLFKHHVQIAPDAHWPLAVLQEVLIDAVSLLPHAFGHHVVQSIIEHGLPDHRMYVICNALGCGDDLMRNAKDRSATYVIRAVLEQSGTSYQFHLAKSLLCLGAPFLASLKQSQYGVHVWKALQAFLRQQHTGTISSLHLDAPTKQEFHLAV